MYIMYGYNILNRVKVTELIFLHGIYSGKPFYLFFFFFKRRFICTDPFSAF